MAGIGGVVRDQRRLEPQKVDPSSQRSVDFDSASYGPAWGNCRNQKTAIDNGNHHWPVRRDDAR
jgi:hypothetical protein